jgi:hypothetical protein
LNLHNRMMNLQAGVPPVPDEDKLPGSAEVLWAQGYKTGHRDARHAAAELALSADEQIRKLREALEEVIAINDEDQGTFRKRGGTRRGLSIVVARIALKETEC